jgi:hypothetical protein
MTAEQDPPVDDQDPTADTPDEDDEDTADDADDAPEQDWDPKSRDEARRKVSEQGAENARLKRELELLRGAEDDESEDDDEGDDDATADEGSSRFEADSWALAQQVYGSAQVDAYDIYYGMWQRATTPADHIAALEAYRAAVDNGGKLPGKKKSAASADDGGERPSREDRLRPRVDTNRSDGPASDGRSETGKSLEQVVAGRFDRLWGRNR